MAESFGDKTAYEVVGGGSHTFAEWDSGASRLARGLIDSGANPGESVFRPNGALDQSGP